MVFTVDMQNYMLFSNSSIAGLLPVRALFYEFPNEPEPFAINR
jgi:alpha-glucosidase